MSIINDVLRDLDQKTQTVPTADPLSMILGEYDEKPKRKYHIYLLILLSILILAWLATALLQFNSIVHSKIGFIQPNVISSEASFSVSKPNDQDDIKSVVDKAVEPLDQKPSEIQPETPVVTKAMIKQDSLHTISPVVDPNTVNTFKVDDSPTSVKITSQPKKASITSTKSNSIKTVRKPVYDYARLLKESPKSIWPIVQSLNVDLDDSPTLLAIAAQAEQRIGNHNNAVNLYKRLLFIQPKEAKWKIAAAISFDQLEETAIAQNLYLQSLQSNAISPSLREFAIKRLKQFSSRGSDEK